MTNNEEVSGGPSTRAEASRWQSPGAGTPTGPSDQAHSTKVEIENMDDKCERAASEIRNKLEGEREKERRKKASKGGRDLPTVDCGHDSCDGRSRGGEGPEHGLNDEGERMDGKRDK